MAVAGGIVYPRDVRIGAQYWGAAQSKNPNYVWRMKGGDLTVNRDLFYRSPGGSSGGNFYFSTEENNTNGATYRNISVNRDMVVGGSSTSELYVFQLNSGAMKVGQDLTIGSANDTGSGAIDFGSGTVNLGRNLVTFRPSPFMLANWNAGTSTLICDGNGTDALRGRKNQTLTTYGDCGIALNNLVIHNECATVSLANSAAGILLLHGNFELECGTFTDNDRAIKFNGPAHLLKVYAGTTITGGAFDNLILLKDAVVNLGSNINADNISLWSGSKLYLSGFTLNADGKQWVGANTSADGVTYEDGMIYGTLAIPEPATLLLMGTGALGVLGYIRRRRMS